MPYLKFLNILHTKKLTFNTSCLWFQSIEYSFMTLIITVAVIVRSLHFIGIQERFTFSIRYFIGIPPKRPGQRHLYRVSSVVPEAGLSLVPAICLTCTTSSVMGSDNENGHWIASPNRQNDPVTTRNEWHEDDEIQIDNTDNKEHRQPSKKDKSKNKNISSESEVSLPLGVCFISLKKLLDLL